MSETVEGLRNKCLKWKLDFECKGLKVKLGQIRSDQVIVSSIKKDGSSKCKVDSCLVCS